MFFLFLVLICLINSTNSQLTPPPLENIDELIVEKSVTIFCMCNTSQKFEQTYDGDPKISEKLIPNLLTYFVIHGWTENWELAWVQDTLKSLLKYTGGNVCGVNWKLLAKPDILIAERNAELVGAHLAKFIRYLKKIRIQPSSVHLVGHSLGAKVSAGCGTYLNGKLGSIFALDPAAPGLTQKNAIYVQCMFTAFGRFSPDVGVGHENFYMNEGSVQPSCKYSTNYFCSHQMSVQYFLYSLDPKNVFYGYTCRLNFFGFFCLYKDKDRLGIYAKRKHGKFDCKATSNPPYAMGDVGMRKNLQKAIDLKILQKINMNE